MVAPIKQKTRWKKAGGYLVTATLGYSLIPLVVAVSNAANNPLGFAVVVGFGMTLGLTVYCYCSPSYRKHFNMDELKVVYRLIRGVKEISTKSDISKARQFWDNQSFLFILIGKFGTVLFYPWAAGFVEVAVAAVLFETWIIFYVILRRTDPGISKKIKQKQEKSVGRVFLLLSFAFFGILFIFFSENGGSLVNGEYNETITIIGIMLALFTAISTAISSERSIKFGEKETKKEKKVFYTLLSVAVADFIIAIFSLLIISTLAMFTNTSISNYFQLTHIGFLIVFAIIIYPVTVICFRKGNHEDISSEIPEINAVYYFTPLLALLWLWWFSDIRIARLDFFIVGTTIILATNIILQARNVSGIYSENNKLSLTALALSIWTVGVIILYRDRVLGFWFDSWHWDGSTDYFAILGLSATIFILILSFRTLRLDETKRLENELTLRIYWKMKELENDNGKRIIKEIDVATKNLQDKQDELKNSIEKIEVQGKIRGQDKFELLEDLHRLILSKSQGRPIIEPSVLVVFAMMTVTITLGTRPQFSDWNTFINDVFSFLFAFAIIFLTLNLFDQKRERSEPTIEIPFRDISMIDILLPVGLFILLVIPFVVLFYGKWLGDWSWTSELLGLGI